MIGTPTKTIEILNKAGIHPTKRLGQHFLIDGNILKKIVQVADLHEDDVVLEIGPGIGSLTEVLLEAGAHVISVEYDKKFSAILKENFIRFDKFHLLEKDATKLEPGDLALAPNKVVSNLPYNISAPLVIKLLDEFKGTYEMIIMVQKEMAMRMTARVGSKDYGQLSLKIEYHCGQAKLLFNVARTVFLPPPKVDSAVIKLIRREAPLLTPTKEKALFRIITAAFSKRRKTLVNSLSAVGHNKDDLLKVLGEMGLDPRVRAEELSLDGFIGLEERI